MSSDTASSTATTNPKKILLSTIGSRGDVQPMVVLALALRAIGHYPILAAGPNFRDFVESFEIEFAVHGPDMAKFEQDNKGVKKDKQRDEQSRQQYAEDGFADTYAIAKDCDMIVAGGAFHHAGRSVAQALNIPYLCVVYCTAVVPSTKCPPARMIFVPNQQAQKRPKSVITSLWKSFEKEQDEIFGGAMNVQRHKLGLEPINKTHRYNLGDLTVMAADETLAPAMPARGLNIKQIGPFVLKQSQPLAADIEAFLQKGPAPIYVGFGSLLFGKITGEDIVEACRQSGYRAIVYQGWAGLDIPDDENILLVKEHDQIKLFPRVAGVVHHGGAGTTTAAALAGVPQLIVPAIFDQYYWANRIKELEIGMVCRSAFNISVDSLVGAIRELITPLRVENAKQLAEQMTSDGAEQTAKLIDTILN